ncbi:hypothetical protein DNTS_034092 [Danionella cerebrum]|uniref:Formin-like protein 1 n=1 Tax=Danionella cerebrum TaxID=2873325 RepID=A0A553RDU5_9TELE|nr:hypothetical protein DNTS_034092 [Danionella translucida]
MESSSNNGTFEEKSVEDLTLSATNSPSHNYQHPGRPFTTKKALRYSHLLSQNNHLHLCIMCLRAIMNYQLGFNQVMAHPNCVNEITLSLKNRSARQPHHFGPRTKALVLELLAAVCLVRGGHEMILAAFNNFREVCGEKNRFEKLMEYFTNEDSNIDFMVACMQFINIVVHSVENMNFRVFLQYEFTQLGLDDYLERLNVTESERLLIQIQAYLDNVFDVGAMLEDAEAKNTVMEHLEELQEQNTQLIGNLQQCENEALEKTTDLQKQLVQGTKELQLLKESLKEAKAQISQLQQDKEREKKLEKEKTLQKHTHLEDLEKMLRLLEERGLIRLSRNESGALDFHILTAADSTDGCKINDSPVKQSPPTPAVLTPPPPPPPPPPPTLAPPPNPLQFRGGTMKSGEKGKQPIKTKYRLPLLNWQAMMEEQVTGTVFTELDDQRVLQELNMDIFEELFKTKAQSPAVDVGTLKVKVAQKNSSKISLLEPNKAKNLAITLRKGGIGTEQICSAIQRYDLDVVNSDFLDLLERFVPSDQERKQIRSFEREGRPLLELSEEDRFIVAFSRIPRLPQRISAISFMSSFQETVHNLNPQLNALIAASISIKSSIKLKKILEIILAFGNYMNSGKRGAAYGFRLQSLDLLLDLKSTDRKQTLLNFMVSIIQEKYPELSSFHMELHSLEKAAVVSLDSLLVDVHSLQKGMKVVLEELEQQKDSSVLTHFISSNTGLLDALLKDSTTAQEVYNAVVEYFGENPKSTPPSAFFPIFTRFIKAYKLAEQENEQRIKGFSPDVHITDPPEQRVKVVVPLGLPQLDLISELKRRQMSPLMREGTNGAIEDIITDLRNQPYIRADGARRSAKWKPAQQLPVSSDISL